MKQKIKTMKCYNCENEDVFFAFQYKDGDLDIDKDGNILRAEDVEGIEEGMNVLDKNLLEYGDFHDVEGYCNHSDTEDKGCDDYARVIVVFEDGVETTDYKEIVKKFFGFDF